MMGRRGFFSWAAMSALTLVGCAAESTRQPATSRSTSSTSSAAALVPELAPDAVAESASAIVLRVEPFPDFYFRVRAQAAEIVAADPNLAPVVEAWMPVQEHVGSFGGFWRFDLAGLLSTSVEAFRGWFEDPSETMPNRAGGTIPIGGSGRAMATAMESAWPTFRETEWPARERRLRTAMARLDREFMPKHRRALRYMLDSLGIDDPKVDVPMYLVIDTHPPGATTYRTNDGPVAVLSVGELLSEGRFSDLEETLLHETCHVLDGASRGEDDVFSVLRSRLMDRGVTRDDERLHSIPHLIMFVQAESTMQRIYDPNHVAYGDTQRGEFAPLYERHGEAGVVVRRLWKAHLDGALDRDQALDQIVDTLIGDSAR